MTAAFDFPHPQVLRIGDIDIQLDGPDQYERFKEDDSVFFMAKQGPILEDYAALAEQLKPKNILEIGVFRGGGTVFFDRLCAPERLIGVDRADRTPPLLQSYIDAAGAGRMKVYSGVDQGDAGTLDRIIRENFPHGIDLVIDDASHWYGPTKASFEAVFPYLNRRGVYAIEDWSWPQAPGLQEPGAMWWDMPSLTNLLIEIVVAHGHPAPLFEEVVFRGPVVYVRRGSKQLEPGGFQLEDYLLTRGRQLPQL